MKLTLIIALLAFGINANAQNKDTSGVNFTRPYCYDVYIGGYASGNPVVSALHPTNATLSDSGYYWQPVYGVGVFSSAQTATVTATSVKANSIIQVGWYGSTVPTYTVTPLTVPTTTIAAGVQFVVHAAASNSDSFYYLIFNHN